MMLKIVTVVGARPQFIKAAVVSRAIAAHNAGAHPVKLKEIIVHTGQHFDELMSEVFFKEMGIPTPDYHFALNRLPHGAMTGRMLEKIEEVLLDEKPDAVMVYGDTNSTLAGALAASKCHIPIVHVEAGLRSQNMKMPEEINRILTDRISAVLCCPTETAVKNLSREGFDDFDCKVTLTGDVMLDAALHYSKVENQFSSTAQQITSGLPQYHLATLHRAENTDDLQKLSDLVSTINILHKHIPVIIPLHPRTKASIDQYELNLDCVVVEPVGYFDMIHLLKHCNTVLTDSGGLQKEAYFFRKPCVTLRDETEWVELTNNGFNILAGTNQQRILEAVNMFSTQKIDWEKRLFGDGQAGNRIVEELLSLMA
jgi:UDP-GlcNAc3NAcA epimerase